MQVDFRLNLGDRVRCSRSGVAGVADGFCVFSDGTLGVCIAYKDNNGTAQTLWRQIDLVEALA